MSDPVDAIKASVVEHYRKASIALNHFEEAKVNNESEEVLDMIKSGYDFHRRLADGSADLLVEINA